MPESVHPHRRPHYVTDEDDVKSPHTVDVQLLSNRNDEPASASMDGQHLQTSSGNVKEIQTDRNSYTKPSTWLRRRSAATFMMFLWLGG